MADARGVGRGGRRRRKTTNAEEENGETGAVEIITTSTAKRQTKRVTAVAVPASPGLLQEALPAQGSPTGTFGLGRTSQVSPVSPLSLFVQHLNNDRVLNCQVSSC
jgi:hypothetical protein